jgi:hypothetical protein
LDWYIARFNQPYIPQAYSGKGFRDKYEKILQAMERDAERNPTVVVSEEAKKLAKELAQHGWNKHTDRLPVAVQLSMDNYDKFLRLWRRLPKKDPDRYRKQKGFIDTVINGKMGPGYISNWFTTVLHKYAGWEKWSGDPMQYVFDHTSKRFQEMGQQWSMEYGHSKYWVDFMELLDAQER